ncbi:MAG: hypothetical protein AAF871_10320 [Pseudomonadota bacterium]
MLDAFEARGWPVRIDFDAVLRFLLLIDLALIAVYLGFRANEFFSGAETPELFKFEEPGTLPSYWLYAKLLGISAVLFVLARKVPQQGFLGISAFFLVLLLYDYFVELPEGVEEPPPPVLGEFSIYGLRPISLDEVAHVTLLLGTAIWAFTYAFRNAAGENLLFVRRLLLLTFLLAIFGVGVDVVHLLIDGVESKIGLVIQALVGLTEDGGEMVVGSLILAAVIAHWRQVEPG